MKKYFYLLLLIAVSSLGFISCNDHDDYHYHDPRYTPYQPVPAPTHTDIQIPEPLYGQRASTMCNGDVLVSGGFDGNNNPVRNIFRYDVNSKTTYDVAGYPTKNDMAVPRVLHTQDVVRVAGGFAAPHCSIVIMGGDTGLGATAAVEVFNPANNRLTRVNDMIVARKNHTVTEINDPFSALNGKFLVVGGRGAFGILSSAEIFDPYTGTFQLLQNGLNLARSEHTATALANGEILITGGNSINNATATGEIFNPKTLQFTRLDQLSPFNIMSESRRYHTATYLNNGTPGNTADDVVLLVGGLDNLGLALDNADFYDPLNYQFIPVRSVLPEPVFNHAATALPSSFSSDAIITGGFTNLNNFNMLDSNPTTQTVVFNYAFSGLTPYGTFQRTRNMLKRRALHTSNHIRFATILTLGGVGSSASARSDGEEFYY